jgi:hypothetical protein
LIIQGGEDQLQSNGSYNKLRDKSTFGAPEIYQVLNFSPDMTLTLTAQSNNFIAGLNLDSSGTQLSYLWADHIVVKTL